MSKIKKKDVKGISKEMLNIEIYKNVANITETLVHFKDILKALIDMGTQQISDIKVMNEKWCFIKDKFEYTSECLDEIRKNVATLVTQMDMKERQEMVKAFSKKNNVFGKIFSFLMKNPIILILIIVVIVGLILVIHGAITGEQFWNGITNLNKGT